MRKLGGELTPTGLLSDNPHSQDRRMTTTLSEPSDVCDEYLRAQHEQVLASPFKLDWLRARAEADRYAAIAGAERLQPRVWPPPPGPSALQLADIARHRQHRIEYAAALCVMRKTPGSTLVGMIVVPAGTTRFGITVVRLPEGPDDVRDVRRSDRPRQRRSHRRQAKASSGSDDPEGPRRGADVIVMLQRRAEPGRREALIELLVELIPAGGWP